MNRTNFVQTGGVPIKAERLQELQEAYSIFNNLGFIAGNFAILTGCEVVGTNVSDGVVVINGEVISFVGGTLSANVIIIENPVSKEFKDGTFKPLHFIRYAAFGTSEDMFSWNDFKRVDPILTLMTRLASVEKKTAVFQSGGGMVLWNKPAADIPVGWAEVVDWRGRIPVGMDASQIEFNTIGKIGGDKELTLTKDNIPPLDLTLPVSSAENSGGDSRYINATDIENAGFKTYFNVVNKNNNATKVKVLNPYRTVLFIEFIG